MTSVLQRVRIGRAVVALGAIIFLSVPVLSFHRILLKAVDFKTVYGSAKCLLDGRDPYQSKNLRYEFARSGGDVSADADLTAFKPYQALYPPSSLFWVLPFTLLPYTPALAAWLAAGGLLFVIAAFLMADIADDFDSVTSVLLVGLFLATSVMLMLTAQPSAIAISLCVIGVWSLLRQRFPFGGAVCFALSLALKPQIGGLVLVYFLFARGPNQRKALLVLILAALFCVPGVVVAAHDPGAAHWAQKISTNLAGSSMRGSVNDPGPNSYSGMLIADLQPVIAVFADVPRIYQTVSWAIGGSLLLAWLYIVVRARPSIRKDLLGVAAIACLSLVPFYHRNYDVRLLLLTFPAAAMLVAEGGAAGATAIAIALANTFGSHSTFVNDHIIPRLGPMTPMKQLIFLRTTPLVVLASGIFYLVLFGRTLRRTRPETQLMEDPLQLEQVA